MRLGKLLFALAFLTAALQAQPGKYAITTLAGDTGAFGSIDGPAHAPARFNAPFGVARDASGNLFVAEPSSHTVRKISPTGFVTTVAGLNGASGTNDGIGNLARFNQPSGVTANAAGDIFVSDFNTQKILIRHVTADGTVTTVGYDRPNDGAPLPAGASGLAAGPDGSFAVVESSLHRLLWIAGNGSVTVIGTTGVSGSADGPAASAQFNLPEGVAFGPDGALFVADTGNHTIRKVAADGTVSTVAGTAGIPGHDNTDPAHTDIPPSFDSPRNLSVDTAGNVFVADTNNQLIRKIATDGTVSTLMGVATLTGENDGPRVTTSRPYDTRLTFPTGLFIAGDGTLYLTDQIPLAGGTAVAGTVRKITPAGLLISVAGHPADAGTVDGLAIAGRLHLVDSVALDSAGNVYVTGIIDHVIRKISPEGNISTYAGKAYTSGSTNGGRLDARFKAPRGLAIDKNDNLYIADRDNHVIRKISPDGTVSTVAGLAGTSGSADGATADARFFKPNYVAVGAAGTLYASDSSNFTIRKIAADGTVSTLAGKAGQPGTADGTGENARFGMTVSGQVGGGALGLAVASSGHVYVADRPNETIREITPDGVVTTIAGAPLVNWSTDGAGSIARFDNPSDISIDGAGNLYVADYSNNSIRKISPDYSVTTVAGPSKEDTATPLFGHVDASGASARFNAPIGIVAKADGTVYIADSLNGSVRIGVEIPQPPSLLTQPASVTRTAGSSASLSVTANSTGLSYQWYKDGVAIDGATGSTLALSGIQALDAGDYTVVVTNVSGSVTSRLARLTVGETVPSRIANMSVRSIAGFQGASMIVGFVMSGGDRDVLLRATGPALDVFHVADLMPDPELALHTTIENTDTLVASNNNWGDDGLASSLAAVFAQVGAFAIADTSSTDAALVATVNGARTFHVNSHIPGDTGVVLAEVYDLGTENSPRLVNISTRNHAGTGNETLIAGFYISGNQPKKILVRAIGPTLAAFGVSNSLADPRLELHTTINDADQIIAQNDNWSDEPGAATAFASSGAFALPDGSLDAAIVMTLPGGSYTAHLTGVNGTTGEALVEVYEVP